MGEPLEHDAAEIDCRFGACLKRDLHDPAFHGGRLVIALDVVAAHHIENDVGAFATSCRFCGGDEILRPVVHRDIGADLAAGVTLPGRSGRGYHASPECLCKLDCRCPDAGGATMNEQGLVRAEATALEYVVPH